MTTDPTPTPAMEVKSTTPPVLKGIGMLEPKEAINRYYDAFGDILKGWASQSASVTPIQIEMCNAFSALRYSLDSSEALPEKYDSDSAIRLIKDIGLSHQLGL
ncbi:hypothetical protein EB795_23165 [Pseudomonas mandelii]|uniref:hypothetical protein n=1 Tax=Pseudomonas mandelii TaxID=75612 RepID=UPI0012B2D51C|nr:hypothetical protein [Pseudomonas mandelii]MSU96783.1 hypothetical protein [Pseudomonas mandelii]